MIVCDSCKVNKGRHHRMEAGSVYKDAYNRNLAITPDLCDDCETELYTIIRVFVEQKPRHGSLKTETLSITIKRR